MAERTEPREKASPSPPVWRRRRFWQLVIAVEIVVALVVSFVADDAGAAIALAVGHCKWYPKTGA
jgi:hypothetical protein